MTVKISLELTIHKKSTEKQNVLKFLQKINKYAFNISNNTKCLNWNNIYKFLYFYQNKCSFGEYKKKTLQIK